jgi:hypothetical protein
MILQSFERFDEIGELLPGGNVLNVFSRSNLDGESIVLAGYYGRLGRKRVMFWWDGEVFNIHADNIHSSLSPERKASWRLDGQRASVVILPTSPVTEIRYRINHKRNNIQVDATPNSSDEDWDFGLFICNIINSPERRARLCSGSLRHGPDAGHGSD